MPPIRIRQHQKKFSRTLKYVSEFQEDFLESQLKSDLYDGLADCNLIVEGSLIPVHSVLLGVVSPFFRKCFEEQGESYANCRTILLCDFTYTEVKNFVQLLYTGSVQASQDEIEQLKETLAYFEVENQENINLRRATGNKDSSKKEIRHVEVQPKKTEKTLKKIDTAEIKTKVPAPKTEIKKPSSSATKDADVEVPLRTPKKNNKNDSKKSNQKRKYNDSDYEPDTDEESAPPPQKRSSTESTGSKSVSSSIAEGDDKDKKKDEDDDEEDKHIKWSEPDYNDMKWFETEAKRCQFCSKVHPNPAQASMCITGHNRLRCYFCFKVCKNTEKLFEHFKSIHKQAGRESSLLCPYCDQTTPYKSVSCHVISTHFKDSKTAKDGKSKSSSSHSGRPVITIPDKEKRTVSNTKPSRPQTQAAISGVGARRPVVMLPKVILNKDKDNNKSKKKRVAISTTNSTTKNEENEKEKKKKDGEIQMTKAEPHHYVESGGGDKRIKGADLDVTIRRKGIDGKFWVWRIMKSYSTALE